jgi:hypothetical protein
VLVTSGYDKTGCVLISKRETGLITIAN